MADPQAEPVLIWDRVDANRRNTVLLLLVFVALMAVVSIAMGVILGLPYPYAPLLIIPFLIVALVSYYSSSRVALAISQAREVSKDDEPELFRTVENLCIGAGLPMPKVYVIEDGSPNAFATGRDPEHAAIAVTRGLLQKLDKLELEAVVAHELSHVGNYDIRVMTIVVVLVGLSALMADFALRLTFYGAGRRSSNRGRSGGSAVVIIYAIALLAVILTPITTAAMSDQAKPEHLQAAIDSMIRLNRHPSHVAQAVEAHSLTDVTGFSILGHSYEMAAAGKVALRLSAGRLPLLPGALEYASQGIVTGGADRNRSHLQDKVSLSDEISKELEHVLFDPQTSGGLLMAVAPEKAGEVEARFAAAELSFWQIGEVVKGEGVQVVP